MKKPLTFFFIFSTLLFGIFSISYRPAQTSESDILPSATPESSTIDLPSSAKPTLSPTSKPAKTKVPNISSPAPLSGPIASVQLSPTARLLPTSTVASEAKPYLPVRLETMVIFSKFMGGAERVMEVYLPGEYTQNTAKQFPVLYVFDGQQLPEIGFQQTLNEMMAAGEISQFIVVAVHSTEGDLRREELGAGTYINSFGWGTSSEAFNQFMINELVPKVNNSYRTLTGAKNTGVMGWSLGGLTSFFLAWQFPDVFGVVGAFSPSFWWRTESQPGEELQARVIPNLIQAAQKRPGLRMWFEAGTKELPYSDIDHNGVIDMIQDVQDVWGLLAQKGYQPGTDMVYLQVEGGQHELSTWQEVLPDFLQFAFPSR